MQGLTQNLEFAVGEITELSARDRSKLQRTDPRPNESGDGIADFVEHLAHDPVATFVDHNPNNRAVLSIANWPNHLRRGSLPVDHDSAPEPIQHFRWWVSIEKGFIFLVDAVAWVHDSVGHFTIVRQQQQALGLPIKAANRHNPFVDGDQIHDGVAAAFVRRRRNVAARFVEQDIATADGWNQLAVDFNFLRTGINAGTEFSDNDAVNANSSFENKVFGAPA